MVVCSGGSGGGLRVCFSLRVVGILVLFLVRPSEFLGRDEAPKVRSPCTLSHV